MELIKELYYEYYLDSDGYNSIPNMQEAVEANSAYISYIKGLDVSQQTQWMLDDLAGQVMAAYEMQGCCYGFSYAVQLLRACGIKEGALV